MIASSRFRRPDASRARAVSLLGVPREPPSFSEGVGSNCNDEAPVAPVAGSDVGSADAPPGPHVPEFGKTLDNSAKATT
jgi:hypothetical protein